MIFSEQQENIFEAIQTTRSNICVNAAPGSGKTTTIVEGSKRVKTNEKTLFLAFANHNVDSLKSKLSNNVECSTIHSLGMRSLLKNYGRGFKVEKGKTFMMADSIIKKKTLLKEKEKLILRIRLQDVMKLSRLHLIEPNAKSIEEVCVRHAFEYDDEFINDCVEMYQILHDYNNNMKFGTNIIDFEDMIYLPVISNIALPRYDTIFVDEFQDLNKAQHEFVKKLSKRGRIISVGDRNQAIYEFCGADVEAFIEFEKRENTISLPLSTSYRCPVKVVNKAREIYQSIDCWDKAIIGDVRYGVIEEITDYDFVLCRNMRPLINLFFRLLEKGKRAEIVGKEILDSVKEDLKKFKNYDTEQCIDKMLERLTKIKDELVKRGIVKYVRHPKFINYSEKIKIVKVLIEYSEAKHTKEVLLTLDDMIKSKGTIKLMTIHKSKGLENKRVFIIEGFEGKKLIPSKYAVTQAQKTQEQNLQFVAYTRALEELVLIANCQ